LSHTVIVLVIIIVIYYYYYYTIIILIKNKKPSVSTSLSGLKNKLRMAVSTPPGQSDHVVKLHYMSDKYTTKLLLYMTKKSFVT